MQIVQFPIICHAPLMLFILPLKLRGRPKGRGQRPASTLSATTGLPAIMQNDFDPDAPFSLFFARLNLPHAVKGHSMQRMPTT